MKKIGGVILIAFGLIWVISRTLNISNMISIIGGVKKESGLLTAIWRLFVAEGILGYGFGFALMFFGLRLLKS